MQRAFFYRMATKKQQFSSGAPMKKHYPDMPTAVSFPLYFDLQKYELFLNQENNITSACERRQLPHRFDLGLVYQICIDIGGADVGVAHQLLHGVYRYFFRQQQHTERVPCDVE